MKRIANTTRLLWRFARWNCHTWLPGYVRQTMRAGGARRPGAEITDIMVLVTDHFEPARKEGEIGVRRVREWCERYAQTASRHRDSDGVMPQHTWFYRYDYPNYECIRILSEFVYRGFGEIEFHLHHGHDTAESFAAKIRDGVAWFNEVGAMLTAEPAPKKRFAYIAGNWALDNGRRDASMSGCNTELAILGSAGCYADFTFPAFSTNAQPRVVNSIYYATDTPEPKSYASGVAMQVGGAATGDLLIFEGPLYVDWREGVIEYASLETFTPYSRERLDYWLRAGVSVAGRPEWVFVKLHTHGMQSREVFLGPQLDQRHTDLEALCSRTGCRLHYVTAREAYNIAKAAEAGKSGDAGLYRDFEIAPPVNRRLNVNAPTVVRTYSTESVHLEMVRPQPDTVIRLSEHPLCSVRGECVKTLEMDASNGALRRLRILGEGECRIGLQQEHAAKPVETVVTLPYVKDIAV